MLDVAPHPLLALRGFVTRLPGQLGGLSSPLWLTELLVDPAVAPVARTEELRSAIRDLLRHGGYKPTGRGKPSSEYLVRAAAEGGLGAINLAVDACNAVSLHSGFPISVVDLDRVRPPLSVAVAPAGAAYVFNATGQTIDCAGLLCLCDADGPCANAVKDSQRTKTHAGTRSTLSLIWGHLGFVTQLDAACAWYCELLERAGAATEFQLNGS